MKKYGIIYVVSGPSGKVYVGQTIHLLRTRKRWHFNCAFNKNSPIYNTKFCFAIRKYNNDLVWKVLHKNVLECLLDKIEIEEISNYDSYRLGYNSTPGGAGAGRNVNDETRKKQSLAKKGVYSGENNPMYGKTHTDDVKNMISSKNKGKLRGENNPMSKLNYKLANEIREKYKNGCYSYRKLAKIYGVSGSTIHRIICDKGWNT